MDSKFKNTLILIGLIGALLASIYYFASPYQNCIRAIKAEHGSVSIEREIWCLRNTNW